MTVQMLMLVIDGDFVYKMEILPVDSGYIRLITEIASYTSFSMLVGWSSALTRSGNIVS